MGGLMSRKEVRRAQTLDVLGEGNLTPPGVRLRYLRRRARRYQWEGRAGLAGQQRGETGGAIAG